MKSGKGCTDSNRVSDSTWAGHLAQTQLQAVLIGDHHRVVFICGGAPKTVSHIREERDFQRVDETALAHFGGDCRAPRLAGDLQAVEAVGQTVDAIGAEEHGHGRENRAPVALGGRE